MTDKLSKDEAISKLNRLQRMKAVVEKKAKETVGATVQTVTVGGTAFLLSYLRGRNGVENEDGEKELNVGGVPVALVAGVGGHIAAFAGIAGNYSDYLHHVGSGALAAYGAEMGYRLGSKAQIEGYSSLVPPRSQRGTAFRAVAGSHSFEQNPYAAAPFGAR